MPLSHPSLGSCRRCCPASGEAAPPVLAAAAAAIVPLDVLVAVCWLFSPLAAAACCVRSNCWSWAWASAIRSCCCCAMRSLVTFTACKQEQHAEVDVWREHLPLLVTLLMLTVCQTHHRRVFADARHKPVNCCWQVWLVACGCHAHVLATVPVTFLTRYHRPRLGRSASSVRPPRLLGCCCLGRPNVTVRVACLKRGAPSGSSGLLLWGLLLLPEPSLVRVLLLAPLTGLLELLLGGGEGDAERLSDWIRKSPQWQLWISKQAVDTRAP